MKKNLFIYLLTVLCAVNLFTACSDDDDAPKFPIDSELAGNYRGKLDVKITQDGQEIPGGSIEPQFISVSKAGESAVNLAITDFSFMGIKIGDIKIDNCQLNELAGAYTFAGTTTVDTEALTAAVDATGAFAGNKLTISMDIEATVKVGNLKQRVKVTYEGTKLNGNEKSESQILSFIFDKEVAPVDSLVIVQPTIDEENKTITFMVADTTKDDYLKTLVPTIKISEGATISPASGAKVDFSKGIVTYTVTAENGTKTEYKVSVAGRGIFFDFEDWTVATEGQPEDKTFYEANGWASCNAAVHLIKAMGSLAGIDYQGIYPISSTEDGHNGKAAYLESVDTKGGDMFGTKVPKVTAATIFLGTFNAGAALGGGAMKTTEFGIMYFQKPEKVNGYYKYTPGTEFYDAEGKLVEGKTDECALSAVLYEVENEDETLDGSNIYTSDKIVATAMFKSNKTVEEYTPFELNLEYKKEYDPAKKYKFAVIFSASADGAAYNAAVGSKLWIDDVLITNAKQNKQ